MSQIDKRWDFERKINTPVNPKIHEFVSWNFDRTIATPNLSFHVEELADCWNYDERSVPVLSILDQPNKDEFVKDVCNHGDFRPEQLPCVFTPVKDENPEHLYWCRTHQVFWGTESEVEQGKQTGRKVCSKHSEEIYFQGLTPMSTNSVWSIHIPECLELSIWCTLPPVFSKGVYKGKKFFYDESHIALNKVDIHFNCLRKESDRVGSWRRVLSVTYLDEDEIKEVVITPPMAFEFVRALDEGREEQLSSVNCPKCGEPHNDQGVFATKPHRKHLCANCGEICIFTPDRTVGTSIKPLYDLYGKDRHRVKDNRVLDLDSVSNLNWEVRPSSPAFIWIEEKPQIEGVHVLMYDEENPMLPVVDETFGAVVINGKKYEREDLLKSIYAAYYRTNAA